jgi:hypothetical protein
MMHFDIRAKNRDRAVSFAPPIVLFIKCERFRAREANGFDHVTLTRGPAALAVATNALAVKFSPPAS